MSKIINIITNILGLALIPVGAVSVFTLEKVNWLDFIWVIVAAMALIYLKNNRASKIIESFFNKFIDSKYGKPDKSL